MKRDYNWIGATVRKPVDRSRYLVDTVGAVLPRSRSCVAPTRSAPARPALTRSEAPHYARVDMNAVTLIDGAYFDLLVRNLSFGEASGSDLEQCRALHLP